MDQYEPADALKSFSKNLVEKFLEEILYNSNLQNSEIIKDIIAINCCKQIPMKKDEEPLEYMKRIYELYKVGRNLMK